MSEIAMYVIGVLVSTSWGLLFYSKKKTDSKLEEHDKAIAENKQCITALQSKMWTQDDLEKAVEDAVEKAFLKFENKLLKDGRI